MAAGDLITLDYFAGYAKAADVTWTQTATVAYQQWITAASAAFLSLTNRACIAPTQFTETVSGDGTDSLILRNTPILSVLALSIDGVASSAFTTGPQPGYEIADNGFAVILMNGCFSAGRRNVAITYMAGYNPIPADVQELIAEMVQMKRAKFPRIDKVSDTLPTGAGQTTSFSQKDLPPMGMLIVQKYKTICRSYSG